MKTGHWIALGAAGALITVLIWPLLDPDNTGGFGAPAAQPEADTDLEEAMDHSPDGHNGRLCLPSEHHAGYTYTPHRYPRTTGGEITALIHRGFSPMRVPNVSDVQWLIAPPSEVMF